MDKAYEIVLTAAVGILGGFGGGFLKAWIDDRIRVDTDLAKTRKDIYVELWKLTDCVPQWPRSKGLTYKRLVELSGQLRDWYFTGNGLYLSQAARKAYGRVQELVQEWRPETKGDQPIPPNHQDYTSIQERLSLLRTELTRDLQSRRRSV